MGSENLDDELFPVKFLLKWTVGLHASGITARALQAI